MDAATAVILAAIIGGVFSVVVELIKIVGDIIKQRLIKKEENIKSTTSNNETKIKKTKIHTKKETDNQPKPRKKFLDLPFWQRTGIIFLFTSSLVVIFLYHTGIVFFTPIPISDDPCPMRQNIQTDKDVEIKVKNGYVAYFMGWKFDGKDGGFFVTFKGPYKRTHSFKDGIYCPPIPEDTELPQKTVAMLMVNCESSKDGCSKTKTCTQNIFAYHLFRGRCHEK